MKTLLETILEADDTHRRTHRADHRQCPECKRRLLAKMKASREKKATKTNE